MAKMIIILVALYLFYKYLLPIIIAPLKMLLKGCLFLAIFLIAAMAVIYSILT